MNDRLPILVSARVRLNEEQRSTLKKAWQTYRAKCQPVAQPALAGSGLSVSTAQNTPSLEGFAAITVSDLIGTRESIQLTTLIQLQKALGVTVTTEKDILDACKGYCSYMFKA